MGSWCPPPPDSCRNSRVESAAEGQSGLGGEGLWDQHFVLLASASSGVSTSRAMTGYSSAPPPRSRSKEDGEQGASWGQPGWP